MAVTTEQVLNTDLAGQPTQSPVMLHAVGKRFGRRRAAVTALDSVSLSFPAGSFTAVRRRRIGFVFQESRHIA
jgi:hypothetical protein